MSTSKEPNPPSRKEEDFPKTNTIPDGWVMDALMEVYNSTGSVYDRGTTVLDPQSIPVPATGTAAGKENGKAHPVEQPTAQEPARSESESLFTRRLEPFPSASDLTGMWL